MKSVKFKELPEKVQTFLYENQHSLGYFCPENDIQLNWLHNISIWDKATDEERLAYAEWRYNFGVRLKDAYDDEEYDLKLRDTIFYLEKDPRSPHDILLTRHEHHTDITIYDSDKNKWAEIIEEPEKEDTDKVYREIAKEIIGNARVHEFTSIEYITVESAESMLIEALKKGKEL